MYQNKTHTMAFAQDAGAGQRLGAVKQALIDLGVPSRHQLYLQLAKYDDLYIGVWPELYCSDADLNLATSVLIIW